MLQDSFCEVHALQCGYLHAGHADRGARAADPQSPTRPSADIREAIGGNLCRCTGYKQIVEAIALAAERLRGAEPAPRERSHGG